MKKISFLLTCLTVPLIGLAETMDQLVKIDGIYHKISSDTPFSGQVRGQSSGLFKNGLRHGNWTYRHANGQLKSEGAYIHGEKDGMWRGYYGNGQLFYKGGYRSGKKIGPWVSYYEDAKIFYKGEYQAGKEHGTWIGFNPDGSVWAYRTGFFRAGVKISD